MDTTSTAPAYRPTTRFAPERTRPAALVWLSLAIAYGGGGWLHTIHAVQGATEGGASSGVTHWLRDSTLAVPVVFVGVWLGLRLVRSLLRPFDDDDLGVLRPMAVVVFVSIVTSVALALASPAHAVLFPAEHHHLHAGMAVPAHMALEGVFALLSGLVITSVVVVALRGRMWSTRTRPVPTRTRLLLVRRMVGLAVSGALIASFSMRSGLGTVDAQVVPAVGP
ncbi:MAG TPA: hypothetical protein VLN74_02430, partial [Ilumatobacteraceae bacterium]|nr:hypothetical protein [Ilumatobacteraceae bacterium]